MGSNQFREADTKRRVYKGQIKYDDFDTITAFTSFTMKVPYYYLLITAMALMETVSAMRPTNTLGITLNDGDYMNVLYTLCFNLITTKSIYYGSNSQCRYYTDPKCQTLASETVFPHPAYTETAPDIPTGFIKCIPVE
ncbi:hypothetical protein [Absidia glauca]|uniref:Uncharacterized protein n=1 Tax=Absidia glauca TaxID=4829 RepID=A0A163LQI6_ABSGL|nr:hypothetical protein [Absidia glauca]